MTTDPLDIALSASKPIPTDREELEIERLVPSHRRRITIADHARWQATGRPPHEGDADIEELIHELREVERNHRR